MLPSSKIKQVGTESFGDFHWKCDGFNEKGLKFQSNIIWMQLISKCPVWIITFYTTLPATHGCWDSFTTNNGQVSSVIGPDTANKLKCVVLSNASVSRSLSDMAINVCEQLVLKIKESDYFALPMDRPP